MRIDYKSADYHQKRHGELIDSKELREAWSAFAELAYFSNTKSGAKILEFGAGLGNNLLSIMKNTRVVAVEPSDLGRKIAEDDGIEVFQNLEAVPYGKFDVILCRHVLEHVIHPKTLLDQLYDRLERGGRLVLVLPIDPFSQKPKNNDLNNHLYCWNPRTIFNLLQVCNFLEINIRFEAYGARRKLLKIYRYFGPKKYALCVRGVGRLFKTRELVIEATRD